MDLKTIFDCEAIAILARTIYGESRGQPVEGKRAVANVVLNRVRDPRTYWGVDIVDVCLWPFHFSCWNDRDPNAKIMLLADNRGDPEFLECIEIAQQAVAGRLVDNTFNSMHYINPKIAAPFWAKGKEPAVTIGDHEFYNNVA